MKSFSRKFVIVLLFEFAEEEEVMALVLLHFKAWLQLDVNEPDLFCFNVITELEVDVVATVLITVEHPDPDLVIFPDTEVVEAAEDDDEDESLGEVEMSPLAMVTQGIHQVRPIIGIINYWIGLFKQNSRNHFHGIVFREIDFLKIC